MEAVVRGVVHVLATWKRVDGVGVRTDCRAAVTILSDGAPPHRRQDLRALQEWVRLAVASKAEAQGSGCRLRLRWVPGHQGTRTTAGYLNNRVDRLAARAFPAAEPDAEWEPWEGPDFLDEIPH